MSLYVVQFYKLLFKRLFQVSFVGSLTRSTRKDESDRTKHRARETFKGAMQAIRRRAEASYISRLLSLAVVMIGSVSGSASKHSK